MAKNYDLFPIASKALRLLANIASALNEFADDCSSLAQIS